MFRNVLATTAVAVMAGTAFAGTDYLFPSSNPPGGKSPSDIPQYVTFIWDDNGYSGEPGTIYEPRSGDLEYKDYGYVGGVGPDWQNSDEYGHGTTSKDGNGQAYSNPLNINEGDMGLSWAVKTFGKKIANKGTGHMTFNMISGLFIPSWGEDLPGEQYSSWKNRVSEYGGTKDDAAEHASIAISWGRENRISKGSLTSSDPGTGDAGRAYMEIGMKKMLAAGHEIGNHTVDHIETNSIWPKDLWPGGELDGFDSDGTTDMLGEPWDERAAGYSDSVASRGWKKYAGKKLKKSTWDAIIALGEVDGPKNGINPTSDQGGRLQGFRAPRLEINSNMFSALADAGYLYDCGVEEGMEENVDGTNFLWPYTVDNGVPNFTSKTKRGETIYATSFPTAAEGKSLWEIPVNLMIVPDGLRENVLKGHNKLRVDGEGSEALDMADWDGKITGFDFNMFILWAMTGDEVVETMNHTLDLHYDNNRAPMQVGCHTDYFTPMYDNATLENDGAFKYALPTYNPGHGNTWEQRKTAFEAFADYAAGKADVEFVSGYELIQNIKDMIKGETIKDGVDADISGWAFIEDGVGSNDKGMNSSANSISGSIEVGNNDAANNKWAQASYAATIPAGSLKGMTHLSLDYNINVPMSLRFYVEGDNVAGENYQAYWEVILDNKFKDVASGPIPAHAFEYGEYTMGEKDAMDVSKINRIEIAPVAAEGKTATFEFNNIKFHGSESNPDDTTTNPTDEGATLPDYYTWTFTQDDVSSADLGDSSTYFGDGFDGEIDLKASNSTDNKWAYSAYASWFDSSEVSANNSPLKGLTHVSFDYDVSNSVEFQVWVKGNQHKDGYDVPWIKTISGSGSITVALSDLGYGQYAAGGDSEVLTEKISALGFAPTKEGAKTNIDISNLKVFGTELSSTPISDIAGKQMSNIAVKSISNGAMNFAVPTAGAYKIDLYSASGRLVRSFSKTASTAGIHSVDVSGVSAGVYMLRIQGATAALTTKALIK